MRRRFAAAVVLAVMAVVTTAQAAVALDEPRVPEQVSSYFATGLVPRLTDLFGAKAGAEVVFDNTDKVGAIHRVLSFTTAFLAGAKTGGPTELTNNWIAAVTTSDGTVAGLATVWINPASDLPELADFAQGPRLANAIADAPKGTLIIRDDAHGAWFATDGTTLTPLVSGTSGVVAPITPVAYQRQFSLVSPAETDAGPNGALLIAVLVLGVVVVLLAIFVLLPDRRRRSRATPAPLVETLDAPAGSASVVARAEPDGLVPAPAEPDDLAPAPADTATQGGEEVDEPLAANEDEAAQKPPASNSPKPRTPRQRSASTKSPESPAAKVLARATERPRPDSQTLREPEPEA